MLLPARRLADLCDGGTLRPAQHGQHRLLLGTLAWLARGAGLAGGAGAEGSTLTARLGKKVEDYRRWQDLAIELPPGLAAPASFQVHQDRPGFQLAFLTRMLFSCLVDADHLCTERFIGGGAERGAWSNLAKLKPLLEAHLFDFDGDLYGRRIHVEFVAKLRDEQKFADLDAMVRQIDRDAAQARRILGLPAAAAAGV